MDSSGASYYTDRQDKYHWVIIHLLRYILLLYQRIHGSGKKGAICCA